jgi:hypothetical protein
LKYRHIPTTLLQAILDIYKQNEIFIKFNNKGSKLVEINNAYAKVALYHLTLFNIYLDEIITKWQNTDIIGIKLSKNQRIIKLNNNRIWFNYVCTENKIDGI